MREVRASRTLLPRCSPWCFSTFPASPLVASSCTECRPVGGRECLAAPNAQVRPKERHGLQIRRSLHAKRGNVSLVAPPPRGIAKSIPERARTSNLRLRRRAAESPKAQRVKGFGRMRLFAVLWLVLYQFPRVAATCRLLHCGRNRSAVWKLGEDRRQSPLAPFRRALRQLASRATGCKNVAFT